MLTNYYNVLFVYQIQSFISKLLTGFQIDRYFLIGLSIAEEEVPSSL